VTRLIILNTTCHAELVCHAEFISASHPNPASAELVCHAEFISASHPNPASAKLVCHAEFISASHPNPACARLYPVAITNNTCHAEFISASHPNPASAELVCHAEFISASHPNPACAELVSVFQHLIKKSKNNAYLNTMSKRAYHNYWVYILTNKPNGTLYIGATGGIDDRMERHITGEGSKFTAKYNLKLLLYFEEFQYTQDAIAREKQLKNWRRSWKINLIEKENPNWENLWTPLGKDQAYQPTRP
jgi:putative endonuclease